VKSGIPQLCGKYALPGFDPVAGFNRAKLQNHEIPYEKYFLRSNLFEKYSSAEI
jgi:hypothetical protein